MSGYNPPNSNTTNNNEVLVNQQQDVLKSKSVIAICPSCKISSDTNAERSCSFGSCVCYLITTPVFWIIFQAIRGKDINCYDASHKCKHCGNYIGYYKAC